MKKLLLIALLIVGCDNSTEPQDCAGVSDIDGNCYNTIQLGGQVWMGENLKTIHYKNGEEISTGYSNEEWCEIEAGAYAIYNNDPSNVAIYGNLYNWYAINDDRGICPEGLHVPTDVEYKELEMLLGMSEEEANSSICRGTNEGSKISGNSELWFDGELDINLEFGTSSFNALPAGYRSPNDGDYYYAEIGANFWSSSVSDDYENTYFYGKPYSRRLLYSKSGILRDNSSKNYGFSIRCLKNK